MLAVAAVAACVLPAEAQLVSEGPLPADLRMGYEEVYRASLEQASDYLGGRVTHKDEVRDASFNISKMMAGGHIVYGDPVTRMVERIADTLLTDWPELRAKLRFYTVLSPDVNAFATAQGMVFVNAGLVAQVEDEAQLAFVLSHEIVHYYRNHGWEEMMGRKRSGNDDLEDELAEMGEFMRRHFRSREMEHEADSLGIACFYLKSPYDKKVADGVFDVLQYSALPFDDVPFDRSFIDAPYYRTDDGCWLDSVAPVTSRDDYDDSRSTHPNLLKRRIWANRQFEGYYGGDHFVTVSREEFARLQHLARIECVRQELVFGQVSRAFYDSYLLCRADSTDREAHRLMAHALYAVSKFRNRGITDVTGDYKKVEGEVQQAYHLLRRIDSRQLSLLTIHKLWQLARRFPGDEAYNRMAEDLMADLYSIHNMRTVDFLATAPDKGGKEAEANETAETDGDKGLTKYERIRTRKAEEQVRNPYSYAFADIMQADTSFVGMMKRELSWKEPERRGIEAVKDDSLQLIFSPSYRVIDNRTDALKPTESDRMEHTLAREIDRVGRRFGLKGVDFSDGSLLSMTDAAQYNDFVAVNEWIAEFWQSKGEFDIIRLTQPRMDSLIDRRGSKLLNLTVALNQENVRFSNMGYLAFFFWPYAPVAIYGSIADNESTAMLTMLVDARRGRVVARGEYSAIHHDTPTLLRSALYDTYRRADIDRKADSPAAAARRQRRQVNGIEGHRLALTAGLSPMVVAPFLRPYGNVEFAIGKNDALALSYAGSFSPSSSVSLGEEMDDLFSSYHPDATDIFDLAYHRYTHTDFAPLGHYWGLGLILVRDRGAAAGTPPGYGLSADFGRNYAFMGRMALNVGFRYNLIFTRFDADMMERLLRNVFLMHVSIGILAGK